MANVSIMTKVTKRQQEILVQYLERYHEVYSGNFTVLRGNETNTAMWDELADILNSCGEGPRKTAAKWLKTWQDWRCLIKKNAAKRRFQIEGMGGGPPMKPPTEIEERVEALISQMAMKRLDEMGEYGIAVEDYDDEQKYRPLPISPHVVFGEAEIPLTNAAACSKDIGASPPPLKRPKNETPPRKRRRKDALISASGAVHESSRQLSLMVGLMEEMRNSLERTAAAVEKQAESSAKIADAVEKLMLKEGMNE